MEFQKNGKFIPKTIYRFFKGSSFGQKKEASPWMTFFLSRIYKRTVQEDSKIIKAIKNIDARTLKGSKGSEKYK
ncbi:MAG: hypothetical protein GF311_12615 [Candidatus Lokiarchaeota archaeon]|nr:hypothetical protein [Candidatus Lokiarchaeota archaeon]MBD3339911.1 hypothetical protein [Candidatus Lokiarchaeota archaeon]